MESRRDSKLKWVKKKSDEFATQKKRNINTKSQLKPLALNTDTRECEIHMMSSHVPSRMLINRDVKAYKETSRI